jgi:glycosyltransferase involved in cell wall biosynthesis
MNDIVSVVMPIYNPDPVFFENALRSVMQQTYSPLEIIISDDCEETSDFLDPLIQQLISTSKVIRYVKNPSPKSIFSNLNNALRYTNGNFIQIFCQDDEMMPELIERHVSLLKNNTKVSLVFSQFDVIRENGKKAKLEKQLGYRNQFPDYIPKERMAYYLLVFGCLPGNLSPVMMKREVFNTVGDFNPGFPIAGDFEFWSRAALHYDFYFNKESLIYIRRHDQQASRILPNFQLVEDRIRIYSTLLNQQKDRIKSNKVIWYLNQTVGIQHFHFIVVGLLNGKMNWPMLKKYFKLLNGGPFSAIQSIILYLLTVNGRIQWLKMTI